MRNEEVTAKIPRTSGTPAVNIPIEINGPLEIFLRDIGRIRAESNLEHDEET
jgi:hypothetical protein